MEPAMAVGTLVNRTVLPVFARVAAIRAQFVPSLAWSLERITILVAPMAAGLLLAADPLTGLLHDGLGNSYAAAALPLKLLAAAALLRVASQVLSPVMIASGRPGTAARLAAATLLALGAGILAVGLSFPPASGIVAVSAVWLLIYPLLLAWGARYLRREWDIRLASLARTFILPAFGIAAMTAIVAAARAVLGSGDLRIDLGIVVTAMAATYAGLFFLANRRIGQAGATVR
jgi:O-antigen/teichoic acid export membrane protein